MKLKGKVAIVTGAGRGIGRAYAHALAKEGARISIAELRQESGQQVAREIEDMGGEAIAIQTDVAKEQSVNDMGRKTAETFGGVDILINNAGLFADDIGGWSPTAWDPIAGPIEHWRQLQDINVDGVLYGMRAVVPHMKKRGKGKIINQSSVGAYMDGGAYGLTKLMVTGMTRMFAMKLAPFKINVNAIAPGITETPAVVNRMRRTPEQTQQYLKERAAAMPWGRIAQPEDMAKVAVFLASDDSEYITGQTISVDGGWVFRL